MEDENTVTGEEVQVISKQDGEGRTSVGGHEPLSDRARRTASTTAEQASLEALIRAADPLISAYFAHQKEMQRSELAHEQRIHGKQVERDRLVIMVIGGLGFGLLLLAGGLILGSQTDQAIELITLGITVAATAFGGYGFALARHRGGREPED